MVVKHPDISQGHIIGDNDDDVKRQWVVADGTALRHCSEQEQHRQGYHNNQMPHEAVPPGRFTAAESGIQ
jgi:hypothetical protein